MERDVRSATRLLVVDSDADEANRLVNVFRDSGQTTRAHHVTSIDALEQAFMEKKKWDLLIVSTLPVDLELASLLERIDHQSKDIPIIIISDHKGGNEEVDYLKKGIKAVVTPNHEDLLLLIANQEIENLYIRRNYRRMSIALNESERQRRQFLDDEVDAIVYIRDGLIRYVNPAFGDMLGQEEKTHYEGCSFGDYVNASEKEDVNYFLESMEETGQAVGVLQCSIVLANNEQLPIRSIIKPTSYEGAFCLSLQINTIDSSISETAKVSDKDKKKLSGLLDKNDLMERLEVSIQQAVSGKGKAALVHVMINDLEETHESKGLEISQHIESLVEEQIEQGLGVEHVGASLGAGNFILLLRTNGEAAVKEISQQMIDGVDGIPVDEVVIKASISVGATILGDTAIDSETLMVRVKHTCSQLEKEGGNRFSFFKPRKVGVVNTVDKYLAMMLSQAMKKKALKLYYQPIVSLKGSEGNYYAANFSMTDIRGREHQSSSFKMKLDNEKIWRVIDRWQLVEASKQLFEKRKDGSDTRVFIQLGGSVINDKTFISWLSSTLKKVGVPASAVMLEVGESNIVRDRKAACAFFGAAKNIGCLTSVSEFGCSVNPLELTESMDIDFIKVDQSFTNDLAADDQGVKGLKDMLVKIAKTGKQIIVPEVPDTAALAPLWHSGIDFVQGSFLSSPKEIMDYSFDSDF
ncbi:MAG: EAL domain-containing protein [Candidatus Endonucleobacter bathymodioli]|uniref:EAL domain-containing protein n=1 Tax=Candidatus Endonucleibacter bathymodioli TaxID=539814 RepID=A0AA90SZ30_9GAMM|nr:EAL domain-containing protein [Candidatus Endonucleobacter bathymodioli]